MQLNATAAPTTATATHQRTTSMNSMNSIASAGSAGSKGSGTATGAVTSSKTAAAPSGEDFFANFGV